MLPGAACPCRGTRQPPSCSCPSVHPSSVTLSEAGPPELPRRRGGAAMDRDRRREWTPETGRPKSRRDGTSFHSIRHSPQPHARQGAEFGAPVSLACRVTGSQAKSLLGPLHGPAHTTRDARGPSRRTRSKLGPTAAHRGRCPMLLRPARPLP